MNTQFKDDNKDLSDYIRDLTKEEIEFFAGNGWVFVPGYIDANLMKEVTQHYRDWTGLQWDEWPEDPEEQDKFNQAVKNLMANVIKFNIRLEDPWMWNFLTQRKLGKAAADLLKVPSVKLLSDTLHVKLPAATGRTEKLRWHQDFPSIPIDRAEAVQTWIALVPITPDMSPMAHMSGSHREKPNGIHELANETIEETYPELFDKYEISELHTYAPGDAVFHHCLTYHTSEANRTNRIRMGISSLRFSARSLYTGQSLSHTDGLGMQPLKLFSHANFPTVYP